MVWIDIEGDELLFNTAEGRRKPDNIRRDPRVIVSVQDRNHPQAYAAEGESAPSVPHIDKLAKRFLGAGKYLYRWPTEERLIVRIEVDRISGIGPGYGNWV
jgi:Pyridoxamine 5'-phosphate oxidase